MNEEKTVMNGDKPRKKKRSLWWLWFLLILAAFAGGCVVGLKINTLPLPTEVRDRLYPGAHPCARRGNTRAGGGTCPCRGGSGSCGGDPRSRGNAGPCSDRICGSAQNE